MIKYIIIFLSVITHIACGQLKPFVHGLGTASSVNKYAVVERVFAQSGTYDNPYSEVYATAIFTSPSSVVDSVPMFWDGTNIWRFRFSPNEVGTWTWTTEATDVGLNGKSGAFTVTLGSRKGTIKKDPSYPYHFVRQDGSRFWFLGDTQWNLFRTIPYDSLNTETVKDYIDLRNSQGYNVVHFVTNTDEQWLDVEQDDMDTLNLTFFQNGDERLQYLNDSTSNKMIGGLLISWANERSDGTWRDWDNFTTSEQRTRYLRYIVGRYSAYNIYFILAGEFNETTTPIDWNDLGTQLKAYDPHDRMTAIHPGIVETSEEFADYAWAGFGDYQQKGDAGVNSALIIARDHSKPVVNSEYSYYMCDRDSNNVVDNWYEVMPFPRTLAWRIAFAGGYFVTGYGATVLGGLRHDWAFTNWDNPIYDDWEAQVGYLKNFFTDKEYWKLTPTDGLVSGGGNGDVFCLYENDKQYYYHVDSVDATLYADLTGSSGIYNLRRLNTRTGAYTDLGQENGGGLVEMVVPDVQDYVFEFMICDTCEYQNVDTTAYIATLYLDEWKDDGYFQPAASVMNEEEPLTGFGISGGDAYYSFHRFANFQAPRNMGIGYAHRTIIDSAKIYFRAQYDRTTTECKNIVYVFDSANSSQIQSWSDFNARAGFTPISWSIEPWYWGNLYSTPDIKTGIQSLVDLSDWSPGNHVQIVVANNGSDADARRRAFAKDSAGSIPLDSLPYLKIYYRTIDSIYTPLTDIEYDYYVDFTNGSDSNPGTIDLPFKTIAKLNTMALANKKIGFKRGETWVIDDEPLLIENDDAGFGTDDADRTIFGAYGTGAKPQLTSWIDLPVTDWHSASGKTLWFDYDGDNVHDSPEEDFTVGTDTAGLGSGMIWYTQFIETGNSLRMIRLKENGRELPYATSTPFLQEDNNVARYYNGDDTWWVNRSHTFTLTNDGDDFGKLWIYTPDGSNPTSYYNNLTWIGQLDTLTGKYNETQSGFILKAEHADYVTVTDIEIEGGIYAGIAMNDCAYFTLDSVDVSWPGEYGFYPENASWVSNPYDSNSDYLIVKHCKFKSGDSTNSTVSTDANRLCVNAITVTAGITGNNMEHALIDSNYFHGWHCAILGTQHGFATGYARYAVIAHNTFKGVNNEYSKPIEWNFYVETAEGIIVDEAKDDAYLLFYANHCDSMQNLIQIGGDSSFVCFNLFTNYSIAGNIHSSSGNVLQYIGGVVVVNTLLDPEDNWVFNNTIVDCADWIYGQSLRNRFDNNLIVNCGTESTVGTDVIYNNIGTEDYQNNNYFWGDGITSSSDIFYWRIGWSDPTHDFINVTELNTKDYIDGCTVVTDARLDLINADYTLPSGSAALNTGTDITTYLSRISDTSKINYTITKDINGNTITPATPNVGAIDNTP